MKDVIEIGKKYIGIKDHSELVDYYNANCISLVKPNRRYKMKYSDDWCAMFVSVLAHKSGLSRKDFPYEVSVYYQWQRANEMNITAHDPQLLRVGDLVVYSWTNRTTRFNHVGMIADIENDSLHVLEGNYKKTVGIRKISKSSISIHGFILISRPLHDVTHNDRINTLVNKTIRGDFGNGAERRVALGDDYEEVQGIINNMDW